MKNIIDKYVNWRNAKKVAGAITASATALTGANTALAGQYCDSSLVPKITQILDFAKQSYMVPTDKYSSKRWANVTPEGVELWLYLSPSFGVKGGKQKLITLTDKNRNGCFNAKAKKVGEVEEGINTAYYNIRAYKRK